MVGLVGLRWVLLIACALGYVTGVPRLAYQYDWSHRINTEDEEEDPAVKREIQDAIDSLLRIQATAEEIDVNTASLLEQSVTNVKEADSGKAESQGVEVSLPLESAEGAGFHFNTTGATDFNHTERFANEIEARISTLVETITAENLTQNPFANYSLSPVSADQFVQILDTVSKLRKGVNKKSTEISNPKPIKVVAITHANIDDLTPLEETETAVLIEDLPVISDVVEASSKPPPLGQMKSTPLDLSSFPSSFEQVHLKSLGEDGGNIVPVNPSNEEVMEVMVGESVEVLTPEGHKTNISNEIPTNDEGSKQVEEIPVPSEITGSETGDFLSEEIHMETTTRSNDVLDLEMFESISDGNPRKAVEETEMKGAPQTSENTVITPDLQNVKEQTQNDTVEIDLQDSELLPGVKILEIRRRNFNNLHNSINASQEAKGKSQSPGSKGTQRKGKAVSGSRSVRNQGFSYSVVDNNSRKVFGHEASYQERTQEGSYFVHFSDDTVLLVTYIADHQGYRPNLRYFQSIGELNQFIATHPKKGYEYPETGAVRPFNRPVAPTKGPIRRPFTTTRRPFSTTRRPFSTTTRRPFRRPVTVTKRPLKWPGNTFSLTTPKPNHFYVTPARPNNHYGTPVRPHYHYGTPVRPNNHYGSPVRPNYHYGTPVRPNNFYVTTARPHYFMTTPRPSNFFTTTSWPSHFFTTTNKFPFWPWYPDGGDPSYIGPPKYGTPFPKPPGGINIPFTPHPFCNFTYGETGDVSTTEPTATEEATTTMSPFTGESETDTTDPSLQLDSTEAGAMTGTESPPSLSTDPVTVVGPQVDDDKRDVTESPGDSGALTTIINNEDGDSKAQTSPQPESATDISSSSDEKVTSSLMQSDAITELSEEESSITTIAPEQEDLDTTTLDPLSAENNSEAGETGSPESGQGAKMLLTQRLEKKPADIVQILPPPSPSQDALMKSLMPKNLMFREEAVSKNSLDSSLITAVYNSKFLTPTNITPIIPYGNTSPEYITITLFPRHDEESEKPQEVAPLQSQNETSLETDASSEDEELTRELLSVQDLTKTERELSLFQSLNETLLETDASSEGWRNASSEDEELTRELLSAQDLTKTERELSLFQSLNETSLETDASSEDKELTRELLSVQDLTKTEQESSLFQSQNETVLETDAPSEGERLIGLSELLSAQILTETEQELLEESEPSPKEGNSESQAPISNQRQSRRLSYLDSRNLLPKLIGEDEVSTESSNASPPVIDYGNEDPQSRHPRLPMFTRQSSRYSPPKTPTLLNARLYDHWQTSRSGLSLPTGSPKVAPVRSRTLLGHFKRP
ncbi:uncharacterized protein LOC135200514 [Macrobrachium nipponense]|uniref:uncharacterized protein LOC135200514 n=1 Tax=Macrobrachium nipponense TaxID=159736 RepID=UPI0030C83A05